MLEWTFKCHLNLAPNRLHYFIVARNQLWMFEIPHRFPKQLHMFLFDFEAKKWEKVHYKNRNVIDDQNIDPQEIDDYSTSTTRDCIVKYSIYEHQNSIIAIQHWEHKSSRLLKFDTRTLSWKSCPRRHLNRPDAFYDGRFYYVVENRIESEGMIDEVVMVHNIMVDTKAEYEFIVVGGKLYLMIVKQVYIVNREDTLRIYVFEGQDVREISRKPFHIRLDTCYTYANKNLICFSTRLSDTLKCFDTVTHTWYDRYVPIFPSSFPPCGVFHINGMICALVEPDYEETVRHPKFMYITPETINLTSLCLASIRKNFKDRNTDGFPAREIEAEIAQYPVPSIVKRDIFQAVYWKFPILFDRYEEVRKKKNSGFWRIFSRCFDRIK